MGMYTDEDRVEDGTLATSIPPPEGWDANGSPVSDPIGVVDEAYVRVVGVKHDGRNSVFADPVTVGDLHSKEIGTGARKSAGKPDWSQFPWWVVDDIEEAFLKVRPYPWSWVRVRGLLASWQRGTNVSLDDAAAMTLGMIGTVEGDLHPRKLPLRALESTVRVLEFGAKKYDKGNWAKGMPWSVCFNSAMSHLTKILVGETTDEESGLPHSAHLMCNLVFLLGYRSRYPEGDDRLPEFRERTHADAPGDPDGPEDTDVPF